ncbi:plasmid segregation protein ParM domain-containing protein, partial [Huaxiibacter chinensis]
NPNRVYLVGGGAYLIEDAIRQAYSTLGERVVTVENPQSALSREICLYHSETGAENIDRPVMAEVGEDA